MTILRRVRRGHERRVAARAGLGALAFSLGILAVSAGQAQATTVSFTDPGCTSWTVPTGASTVRVTATGAAGQPGRRVLSSGSPAVPSGGGGAGGVVAGTLSGLEAGEVLEVCVNQGSSDGGPDPDAGTGGAGGGASGVALGGDPVLIAGGGGGGGDGGRYGADQGGGSAGLPGGVHGEDAIGQPGALGGGGGSQTQGGTGGDGDSSTACGPSFCGPGKPGTGFSGGAPGTGGNGGQIVTITGGGGGGGGGGYYGGGGGGSGATPCTNCGHSGGAGGGGGSDFCATPLPTVTLSGCAATGDNSSPTMASVVFDYPVAPPVVSIAAPANGASYVQGQVVRSSFSCDDGAGGSWLTSCVDQGGRPSGSQLDTSTLGSHTFTVTATTRDGMAGTASVTYQVLPSGGGGASGGGGSGGTGGTGGTGSGVFPGVQVHSQILTLLKNGTVKVKIPCPPTAVGDCVGSVVLKWLGAITVSVRHERAMTFGSARFSIPAGHTGTVTIKLSKTALKLLAHKRKLRVLGKVVAHDARGVSKSSSTTVTLKSAPKRKAGGSPSTTTP